MRIFYAVFGGLIVIVGLAFGYWFAHDKIILGIAAYKLNLDIAKVNQLLHRDVAADICSTALVPDDRLIGFQLRFTGDTTYVVEPVCISGAKAAVVNGTLYGGVKRQYGSGILLTYDQEQSGVYNGWVHLIYGKNVVATGYFESKLETRWDTTGLTIGGDSPAQAACENWGFFCCKKADQATGMQVTTMDCPDRCFQSCNQPPLVLYFNADPMISRSDRAVVLRSSPATVRFGFTVADYDDGVKRVQLDFGDGSMSPLLKENETAVEHGYNCTAQRCVYGVTLIVEDSKGNSLDDLPINKIQVRIEP